VGKLAVLPEVAHVFEDRALAGKRCQANRLVEREPTGIVDLGLLRHNLAGIVAQQEKVDEFMYSATPGTKPVLDRLDQVEHSPAGCRSSSLARLRVLCSIGSLRLRRRARSRLAWPAQRSFPEHCRQAYLY